MSGGERERERQSTLRSSLLLAPLLLLCSC
jgi:hypothetical protein